MSDLSICIQFGSWDQLKLKSMEVRTCVFIREQNIPGELEWDEYDPISLHVLAFVKNNAVATARLLPDGRIGRMAVLSQWRRQRVGQRLLAELLQQALLQGHTEVLIHAQISALAFYQKYGFIEEGSIFNEVGIPHKIMRKNIS